MSCNIMAIMLQDLETIMHRLCGNDNIDETTLKMAMSRLLFKFT